MFLYVYVYIYIYIYANICIYVCSICPYFFGYKHDIDDYPPARTKVEHSFTHVHTRWSTNGPFHTGQICCRAPFLGFSAWISGAGGFPTIVVFGGGFEARVILSLPEVWDTTSVALRKQPKSRHFSEATRHSFMLMIYCFPLPKHPQIIILKIKNRKMPQKHTKTLVVVPFQPPSPSCANICQAGSPSTSLTWRPGRRPMARCKEGFTSLLRRKTLVWYAVIVENTWEHMRTLQNETKCWINLAGLCTCNLKSTHGRLQRMLSRLNMFDHVWNIFEPRTSLAPIFPRLLHGTNSSSSVAHCLGCRAWLQREDPENYWKLTGKTWWALTNIERFGVKTRDSSFLAVFPNIKYGRVVLIWSFRHGPWKKKTREVEPFVPALDLCCGI